MSRAAVVAFWLSAADTLAEAERDRAHDEFNYYTQQTMEFLGRQSIQLVPTRSDSVVIVTRQGSRRQVTLSGLDYPYGYVLVDPGYAEQILAGVYTDEELVEAVTNYFDLDSAPPTVRIAGLSGTAAGRQGGRLLRSPPNVVRLAGGVGPGGWVSPRRFTRFRTFARRSR
ncbi:MAG: hypothetical protein ABI647_05130 [Gemmatimonadota bacterium]